MEAKTAKQLLYLCAQINGPITDNLTVTFVPSYFCTIMHNNELMYYHPICMTDVLYVNVIIYNKSDLIKFCYVSDVVIIQAYLWSVFKMLATLQQADNNQ